MLYEHLTRDNISFEYQRLIIRVLGTGEDENNYSNEEEASNDVKLSSPPVLFRNVASNDGAEADRR